jgi:DNA replication protein DnaC
MLRDRKECQEALRLFTEGKSLFLFGVNGGGKTELAKHLFESFSGNKKFLRLYDFNRNMRDAQKYCDDGHFEIDVPTYKVVTNCEIKYRHIDELKLLDHYKELNLFILDDLYATGLTEAQARNLIELIDGRYKNGKQTVIISNLTLSILSDRIDPGIADRISEKYVLINMGNKSFRQGGN